MERLIPYIIGVIIGFATVAIIVNALIQLGIPTLHIPGFLSSSIHFLGTNSTNTGAPFCKPAGGWGQGYGIGLMKQCQPTYGGQVLPATVNASVLGNMLIVSGFGSANFTVQPVIIIQSSVVGNVIPNTNPNNTTN